MKDVRSLMIEKAASLLASGEVARVIGWKKGEFCHDPSPATFCNAEELKDFTYDVFCGANLSKYLIQESKKEGKTAVFLKPCDTYSFNQLVKEHRIDRSKLLVIGIECAGKVDIEKIKEKVNGYILCVNEDIDSVEVETVSGKTVIDKKEVLSVKCKSCKGKKHVVCDELIAENDIPENAADRFAEVEKLESMTEDERFAFWRGELSKCIRCNACRNVCPACSCVKCVFDNPQSGVAAKANDDSFEEQLFHIIRAFHVAGRCTDCGECSRVCPQHIPLHLLNRKFIKDFNNNYGQFQAGESAEGKTPLTEYTEKDVEPNDVFNAGVNK